MLFTDVMQPVDKFAYVASEYSLFDSFICVIDLGMQYISWVFGKLGFPSFTQSTCYF